MKSERTRILVIDDEEVLLDLIREILEDQGYSVTAVASGPDALNTFLTHPSGFDVVIADEKMPGLSGSELAEEILGVRPGIPVILYTDYPELSSVKKARAVGVRAVLPKSSRTEELVASIRRVLES